MSLTIAVDVDDVCAKTVERWLRLYNQDIDNCDKPWRFIEEIEGWDMAQELGIDPALVMEYFSKPYFWEHVEPVEGALSAIRGLRVMGLRIVFVTSNPHPELPRWLTENGFLLPYDPTPANFIVTNDKSSVVADVLIDDNPKHYRGFPGYAVRFERPWNTGDLMWAGLSAKNWEEVMEQVINLEAAVSTVRSFGATLSPDAPIKVNRNGGRQSDLPLDYTLLDMQAMFALADVLTKGALKYERDNWRLIPEKDHINHAFHHLLAYNGGDQQDDHLEHAFCRLMMAVAQKHSGEK